LLAFAIILDNPLCSFNFYSHYSFVFLHPWNSSGHLACSICSYAKQCMCMHESMSECIVKESVVH